MTGGRVGAVLALRCCKSEYTVDEATTTKPQRHISVHAWSIVNAFPLHGSNCWTSYKRRHV